MDYGSASSALLSSTTAAPEPTDGADIRACVDVCVFICAWLSVCVCVSTCAWLCVRLFPLMWCTGLCVCLRCVPVCTEGYPISWGEECIFD